MVTLSDEIVNEVVKKLLEAGTRLNEGACFYSEDMSWANLATKIQIARGEWEIKKVEPK